MNTFIRFVIPLILLFTVAQLQAQDEYSEYQERIERLKAKREKIAEVEKEALKAEVLRIEERLEAGNITEEEAQTLKEEAAQKRALNIEDQQRMIDSEIALLERNEGDVLNTRGNIDGEVDKVGVVIEVNDEPWDFWDWDDRPAKYDRRTYSDLVMAVGLNNAIIDGERLEDTPYRVGGSRFFEIGWTWRTRVFRKSNWLRFHYGFSFQFNGLKPKGNQYYVFNDGQAELQEFELDLDKSKFRMDNLVFPIHFEFGPSRYREYKNRVRYSIRRQFRMGIGGYTGFMMGARQKLKYRRDGKRVKDKLIGGYNTSDFIYGVSGYIGVGCVQLYAKYDLNPIFQDTDVRQRNISMGLRFEL